MDLSKHVLFLIVPNITTFLLSLIYRIDLPYVYKIVNIKLRKAKKTGVIHNEFIHVTKIDPSSDKPARNIHRKTFTYVFRIFRLKY